MSLHLQPVIDKLSNFQSKIENHSALPQESQEMLHYLDTEVASIFRVAQQDMLTLSSFNPKDCAVQALGNSLERANQLSTRVRQWCMDEVSEKKTPKICRQVVPVLAFPRNPPASPPPPPLLGRTLLSALFYVPTTLFGKTLQLAKYYVPISFFPERTPAIASLPCEVLDQIVGPNPNWGALRRVNRQFQHAVLGLLGHYWAQLKQKSPEGLVKIADLMMRIEECFSQQTAYLHFKALHAEFAPLIPAGKFPTAVDEFVKLQEQAMQLAHGQALVKIWQTLPVENLLATPLEIREWLNDPAHLGLIQNMRNLNLEGLALKVLPKEIGLFIGLQQLNLSKNRLRSLPDEIASLTQLKDLELQHNELTSLPKGIQALTQLRKLDLSQNRFYSFPEEVCSLMRLQELDLDCNQLSSLSHRICNLRLLETLAVSENQLETLPRQGLPTSIKCLYLSLNQLKTLPQSFRSLSRLLNLDLSANQIESIPEEIDFTQDYNDIDLRFNELTSLPPSLQSNDHSTVQIDGNLLQRLPTLNYATDQSVSRIRRELKYKPLSPLGQLHQAILRRAPDAEIKRLFSTLDDQEKHFFYKKLGGEELLFDNMKRFYLAVRPILENRVNQLGYNQKLKLTLVINELTHGKRTCGVDWFQNYTILADAFWMLR